MPTAATRARTNKPKADAEKPAKRETVQQLKNRLRNEAEREVLDAHKPEVIARTQAKYDEHGLEYVRRLSDEEKAAKLIAEQFSKYPELKALFAPAVAVHQAALQGDDVTEGQHIDVDDDYARRKAAVEAIAAAEGVQFMDIQGNPEVEAREGE